MLKTSARLTADHAMRIATVLVYWFVIVFVVLTYGAVNSTAVSVASGMAFGLLLVSIIRFDVPAPVRNAFTSAALLLGLGVCWTFLQFYGLPSGFLANPLWLETSRIIHVPLGATISLTPGDGPLGLLKLALPFGIFLLTLIIFDSDQRAAFALRILAIMGGLFATLGLFQFLFTPDLLLFGEKTFYMDSLTGPFINRNTAGTFFGLSLLILVSLFWTEALALGLNRDLWLDGIFSRSHKRSHSRRAILYGSLVLLTLAALVLTRSRAGIASTFIALLAFILLTAVLPPRRSTVSDTVGISRRLQPALTLLAVAVLFCGFAIVSGQAILRAQKAGFDDVRFCFLPGMIEAARQAFPAGAGLTSFREFYPAFRDAGCGLTGVVDKAHNVYLEGFLSLGVVFIAMLVVAVVSLLCIYISGIRRRRRFRFAGILGICSFLLVLLHSSIDFSIQIPGFAVYYASVSGCLSTLCLRRSWQG